MFQVITKDKKKSQRLGPKKTYSKFFRNSKKVNTEKFFLILTFILSFGVELKRMMTNVTYTFRKH